MADTINWHQYILIGKVGKDLTGFANVRIDRATPLGNPYVMYREEQRQEVCESFKSYLEYELDKQTNQPLLDQFESIFNLVSEGKVVNLQCHCSPSSCHGEVIRDKLIEFLVEHEVVPTLD